MWIIVLHATHIVGFPAILPPMLVPCGVPQLDALAQRKYDAADELFMHIFWVILLVRWSILWIQPHRKWLRNVGLSRLFCGVCSSYSTIFPEDITAIGLIPMNFHGAFRILLWFHLITIFTCASCGAVTIQVNYLRDVWGMGPGEARESERVAGILTCRGPITKIDHAPPFLPHTHTHTTIAIAIHCWPKSYLPSGTSSTVLLFFHLEQRHF